MRGQVNEVAGEQLDISVYRTELDLPGFKRTRDGRALRARIGKVKFAGDAALKQIEMRLQNNAGLDDVQIVDVRRINARQDLRKKIGLLLVVSFKAYSIPGADHRFEQRFGILRRHQLAACMALSLIQAGLSFVPLLLPVRHVVLLSASDGYCCRRPISYALWTQLSPWRFQSLVPSATTRVVTFAQ